MECVFTFTVNGETFEFKNKDSASKVPILDQDVLNALNSDEKKRQELVSALRANIINVDTIKPVTIKSLKEEGIVANCSVQWLQSQFPDVDFPNYDAKILLARNIRVGGLTVNGRVINSNGEEIFVTDGSKKGINELAAYLRNRNRLESAAFRLSKEGYPDFEAIQQIAKNHNIEIKDGDVSDLVMDYMYNRSKYNKGVIIKDSSGTAKTEITLMSDLWYTICDWSIPETFASPVVNALNDSMYVIKNENRNSYNRYQRTNSYVPIDSFMNIIKSFYPDAYNDLIKIAPKASDWIATSEHEVFIKQNQLDGKNKLSDNTMQLFRRGGNKSILQVMFELAVSEEPEYNYSFGSVTKSQKNFTVVRAFDSLASRYNLTYDNVRQMQIVVPDLKGFKIYEWMDPKKKKKVYFPSRHYLTQNSNPKGFDTLQEAEDYVNNLAKTQWLYSNSLIEFKMLPTYQDDTGATKYVNTIAQNVLSNTVVQERQIISSLNVPIDEDIKVQDFPLDEAALITARYKTLENFREIVVRWKIDSQTKAYITGNMDNAEKVVTFIYKLNEQLGTDRTNINEIKRVADIIVNAANDTENGYTHYYIDNKSQTYSKGSGKTYSYTVIKTEPYTVEEYKNTRNQNYPVVSLLQGMQESLEQRFGVKVNLKTSREIAEDPTLKKIANPLTTKAFVYNGEIYINTSIADGSDMLHEYAHIILGIMKSTQNGLKNYATIMRIIANTAMGKKIMRQKQAVYGESSNMDIMEETFVTMFSRWILNGYGDDVTGFFEPIVSSTKEAAETIFNTKITNVSKFMTKSIDRIFSKLYEDTQIMLGTKDDNGESLFNLQKSVRSRKLTNYINEKIRKGEIVEQC